MQNSTQVEKAVRATPQGIAGEKPDASDFSALVSDAKELLQSTATYSGESVDAARVKFRDTLDQFRERVSDAQGTATEKWNRAASATDGYVRGNSWKVIGVAAVVGLVVGALLRRK
jgi:ElaB/YqjD/DUF883 family membrane-anchored ribosome-binding protein